MKTFQVAIPVMVHEVSEGNEDAAQSLRPDAAMMLNFSVKAPSAEHVARLVRERLDPTVGDP